MNRKEIYSKTEPANKIKSETNIWLRPQTRKAVQLYSSFRHFRVYCFAVFVRHVIKEELCFKRTVCVYLRRQGAGKQSILSKFLYSCIFKKSRNARGGVNEIDMLFMKCLQLPPKKNSNSHLQSQRTHRRRTLKKNFAKLETAETVDTRTRMADVDSAVIKSEPTEIGRRKNSGNSGLEFDVTSVGLC